MFTVKDHCYFNNVLKLLVHYMINVECLLNASCYWFVNRFRVLFCCMVTVVCLLNDSDHFSDNGLEEGLASVCFESKAQQRNQFTQSSKRLYFSFR